jgi:WXG100 family type VII secretion target
LAEIGHAEWVEHAQTGGAAVAETAVNRATMATAAGQVETAVGTINGYQSQMESYHDSLIGGWKGDAATAFTNAYTKFSEDFGKVLSALQDIHDKLVSTRSTYTTTEDTNTAAANKIGSLLNQ